MQYFTWSSIQIPLAFVTGISYKKTAKTVEHTGGYISSKGCEAAEMSIQVAVNRQACAALGVDFNRWYGILDGLAVSTDGESGPVTIGGYPIYPELKFALTNKNCTYITDLSTSAPMSIGCDLTLSGVECVKEVVRQRALEFDDTGLGLPKISLTVNGKTLTVRESTTVSKIDVTPNSCEIELFLGSDTTNVNRSAFLTALLDDGTATVTIDLPLGATTYHIIWADLTDGILQISGSIYSESANQALTETFEDCDLSDIIKYLCDKLSMDAEILVNGHVEYYPLNGTTPMEALEALRESAGFVVSAHLGKATFAFLPESISSQKTLEGLTIDEDGADEVTTQVIWRDGEHEFIYGDSTGEIKKVDSVFTSTDPKWAHECLKLTRFKAQSLVVSGDMDSEIRHHSQVSIPKDTGLVTGLVGYYIFSFVTNTMRLEICPF